MPDPSPVYYPVWISTSAARSRGTALCWGKGCATAREAGAVSKGKVDAGEASLAFVVEVTPAGRRPLTGHVYPAWARKIVLHWESLRSAVAAP